MELFLLPSIWKVWSFFPMWQWGIKMPQQPSCSRENTGPFGFLEKERACVNSWFPWDSDFIFQRLIQWHLCLSPVQNSAFVHLCKHSLRVQTIRILTFLLFTRIKIPTRFSEVNFLPDCVVWYMVCSAFHQTYGICNLAEPALLLELERLCSLISLCYLFNFH